MKESLHVFWELLLIAASILMFRSAWLILDKYLGTAYVELLLIAGVLAGVVSLYVLNRHTETKK